MPRNSEINGKYYGPEKRTYDRSLVNLSNHCLYGRYLIMSANFAPQRCDDVTSLGHR